MSSYCSKCGRKLADGEVCNCTQLDDPQEEVRPEEGKNADRQPDVPARERFDYQKAFNTAKEDAGKAKEALGKAIGEVWEKTPQGLEGLQTFIVKMKNKLGFGTPESNALGVYERNKKIVPECIETNENEVPIKQYNIAVLRSRMKLARAEGRLQVTNKRLIFRATGRSLNGKTVQEQEFQLENLKGIEFRKDFRFSLLSYFLSSIIIGLGFELASIIHNIAGRNMTWHGILAFVLGIAAMIPFFTLHRKFALKLFTSATSLFLFLSYYQLMTMYYWRPGFWGNAARVFAVIAGILTLICWLMTSWVPNLIITVKTDGNGGTSSGAVLIRRKPSLLECFFRRANGTEEFSGFAEVMPWLDTDVAMDELGAMLDDLQKLGDHGIEKWKLPDAEDL